jgi:hypothetical protein
MLVHVENDDRQFEKIWMEGTTGVAADQVHRAAETLGRQAETLRADVDTFLANIRAA